MADRTTQLDLTILAYVVSGFTTPEIARDLQQPAADVRMRLLHALKALRARVIVEELDNLQGIILEAWEEQQHRGRDYGDSIDGAVGKVLQCRPGLAREDAEELVMLLVSRRCA